MNKRFQREKIEKEQRRAWTDIYAGNWGLKRKSQEGRRGWRNFGEWIGIKIIDTRKQKKKEKKEEEEGGGDWARLAGWKQFLIRQSKSGITPKLTGSMSAVSSWRRQVPL